METEYKIIKTKRIRLQILDESFQSQLENFIGEHFLPDESAAQAVGLDRNDPDTLIERKLISEKYANLVLTANPVVSVVAVQEENNQLVGMRLSEIKPFSIQHAISSNTELYAISLIPKDVEITKSQAQGAVLHAMIRFRSFSLWKFVENWENLMWG